MTKKTKKIAILEGGISSEREVSLSTGKACFKTFQKLGYNVKSIDTKDLIYKLKDIFNSKN